MAIGVVGRGTVGTAVIELFAHHTEVVSYDVQDDEPFELGTFDSCGAVFICVPTPALPSGEADISVVEAVIKSLEGSSALIVVRSTVPPTFASALTQQVSQRIVIWPEYTGESSYFNPYFADKIAEVPFVIVGGPPARRRELIELLLPVLGPTKQYFQCASDEAALIKYAENTFFATKIAFVNEFRQVCEVHGVDWHTVREGWLLDPRVNPMHTAAFGEDRGFGGKCLPKDLCATIAASQQAGFEPELLNAVHRTNAALRNPLADS